jgi:hypothetical protein
VREVSSTADGIPMMQFLPAPFLLVLFACNKEKMGKLHVRRTTHMTRKRITMGLLVLSIVLTGVFIVGSFVTYAEPISSTDMQNIYLRRIARFGAPILLLQVAALILGICRREATQ